MSYLHWKHSLSFLETSFDRGRVPLRGTPRSAIRVLFSSSTHNSLHNSFLGGRATSPKGKPPKSMTDPVCPPPTHPHRLGPWLSSRLSLKKVFSGCPAALRVCLIEGAGTWIHPVLFPSKALGFLPDFCQSVKSFKQRPADIEWAEVGSFLRPIWRKTLGSRVFVYKSPTCWTY